MFNKKNKKKNLKNQLKNQLKNELEKFNANNAHKEMVIKSGGGINNLLQNLEDKYYIIELNNQKIARLNREINNLESRLIELSITYKFKNSFFFIEINKILFFDKIKTFTLVKIYIYVNLFFNNIFLKKDKILKNIFSFKKLFKFIVVLLNLLFLINNINKII